jgi:hypothetical protein
LAIETQKITSLPKKKKKSLFGESSPVKKKIGCLRWRLSLLIWQSAAGSSSPE